MGGFHTQHLANLAWASATASESVGALTGAAARRVRECDAQGLANMAWALATTSQLDVMFFAVLGRVAEQRMA